MSAPLSPMGPGSAAEILTDPAACPALPASECALSLTEQPLPGSEPLAIPPGGSDFSVTLQAMAAAPLALATAMVQNPASQAPAVDGAAAADAEAMPPRAAAVTIVQEATAWNPVGAVSAAPTGPGTLGPCRRGTCRPSLLPPRLDPRRRTPRFNRLECRPRT